ncbi:IMPACT domain protein, possible chaperone [Schizosaccharomyces osmophilus]|uniref:IMPACT domain protein, possible chaperone n=1 Tax=Schizosaccharomyces osmophilus TaxID=2545709 RepID=A0AAE9W8I9_9SCHI|nr:IMPACT domain protein, possible chaperone [Schizosaccharomyces osmophilus]WBW71320.1 IMPACT domain protein, possible chaperone [Schizosaccharomyces osmophilus]
MAQRQAQLKFGGQGLALTVPNQSLQECSFMSNLITDRESTFLSYFIPSEDPKLLPSYRFMFQECTELKHSNHKMQAWRFPGEVEAFNDDGEEYSGQKLLNTLIKESVYGIVVCVRWYGGQLLGPVRFQHIVDTAKGAIQKYKKNLEEKKQKEAWAHATMVQQQQRQPRSLNPLDQKVRQVTAKDRTVNLLRKTLGFPALQEVDYYSKPLSTLEMLLQSRNSMISVLRSQLQKNKEAEEGEKTSETSKEHEVTIPKEKLGNVNYSTKQPEGATVPSEISEVQEPIQEKPNTDS